MKFFLLIFHFIFITSIEKILQEVNGKFTFVDDIGSIIAHSKNSLKTANGHICLNTCSTCENALYHLKIHGRVDCRFTECPDSCLVISNEYFSGLNNNIKMFIGNQISACDTCFRLDLCHMHECEIQENIVNQAIKSSLRATPILHILRNSHKSVSTINRDTEDYLFNMDLVLKNMDRLIRDVEKYNQLLEFSESLKFLYSKLYKKVLGADYKLISNQRISITQARKDVSQILQLTNFFKEKMQVLRIRLDENSLYDTSVVINVISEYKSFEEKIKLLMDDMIKISEEFRGVLQSNVRIINSIKSEMIDSNSKLNDVNLISLSRKKISNQFLSNLNYTKSIEPSIIQNIPKHHSAEIFISNYSNSSWSHLNKEKNIKNRNDTIRPVNVDRYKNIYLNLNHTDTDIKESSKEFVEEDVGFTNKFNRVNSEMNKSKINDTDIGTYIPVKMLKSQNKTKYISRNKTSKIIMKPKSPPIKLLSNITVDVATPIAEVSKNDLDVFIDKRKELMDKSSIRKVYVDKHKHQDKRRVDRVDLRTLQGIKNIIDEKLNEEKREKEKKSFSNLLKKTFKTMKYLKKKIGKEQVGSGNFIKNLNITYTSQDKINASRKELNERKLNFTSKKSIRGDNRTNKNITHLNKQNLINNSNSNNFTNSNSTKSNNYTNSINVNATLGIAENESPIRLILKENPSFIFNKSNNSSKNINSVANTDSSEPKAKNKSTITSPSHKKSVFSMLFLEKSLKKLDDDFHIITQNLFPDMIFY